MRVVELTTDAQGLPSSVRFQPSGNVPINGWNEKDKNWITIILGENGTRKSLILRLLAGTALGRTSFRSKGHQLIQSEIDIKGANEKVMVIAISGTPNDRLPACAGIPMYTRPTSFDVDTYVYLGPKQNTIGHTMGRQLATLVHSFLIDVGRTFERRAALSRILGFMGLSSTVHLTLTPASGALERRPAIEDLITAQTEAIQLRARNLNTWLSSVTATRGSQLHQFTESLIYDRDASRMAALIALESHRIFFNFHATNEEDFTSSKDPRRYSVIANLIAIGYLKISSINLGDITPVDRTKGDSHNISSTDLSSGQWQLMTSLLNLAIRVKNDSLILIDEPENSLHPAWQRDYIELLSGALAGTHGSHVMIATHSPLIAAGVPLSGGSLLSAKRVDEQAEVLIQDVGAVYAWRPDDVLREKFQMESPRAPELEQLADRLLSIVSGTSSTPEVDGERSTLALQLQNLASGLPTDDPMTAALRALIDLAMRGHDEEKSK